MYDFSKIEKRMRSLVISLKGVLSENEEKEVLNFVDVGEYGVALENLFYIYAKKMNPPAIGVIDEMRELAKMMEIDLSA